MQSATICFPVDKITISSSTTSSCAMVSSTPSRTTLTVGAVSNDSFSMVFLALISWTIPIIMLMTMMSIKNTLLHDWSYIIFTTTSATKTKKQSILKNVNTFSLTMLQMVFTLLSGTMLIWPFSILSWIWSWESPFW